MAPTAVSKDYGHRLKWHAYKTIHDDLGTEFEKHLGEWKRESQNLVMAARTALGRHQDLIEKLKKEMEAERLEGNWLAMLALTLVGGAAFSAVGGLLQHRLGPKLFGTRTVETRTKIQPHKPELAPPKPPQPAPKMPPNAQIIDPTNPARPQGQAIPTKKAAHVISPGTPPVAFLPYEVFDPDLSRVKGKMIGDVGKVGAEFSVHQLIQPAEPKEEREALEKAIKHVESAHDIPNLETRIAQAWDAAVKFGKTYIQGFANMIEADDEWGDKLWERLRREYPKFPDEDLFILGKHTIKEMVNKQRRKWANQGDWYYYSHAPVAIPQPLLENAVEVEIWALWMAREHYWPEGGAMSCSTSRCVPNPTVYNVQSRSGIGIDPIVSRLQGLGAINSYSAYETARRRTPPEQSGVVPLEVNNIYGAVDTYEEVSAITKWAKFRRQKLTKGILTGLKRNLGDLKVTVMGGDGKLESR